VSDAPLTQRIRLPLGFLFAALYLVFARPTTLSLIVGAAVSLVGVGVRAWAAGHIRKGKALAVTGPYAHTRNPLYLGSFLIAAGFSVAAHISLLLVVIALFALVYQPTMNRERKHVSGLFPAEYEDYERNVPLFVPRLTPWSPADRSPGRFDTALYMHHGEWRALLGWAGAVAWLATRLRMGF
jgi:protein-S-isoprenylcysteine O-methyltransferase Ste14